MTLVILQSQIKHGGEKWPILFRI